jgi:hypothetical protein
MKELSHGLSGTAREYYAAAELARRGFLATITNRNAERVDILAAKPNSGRALKIQVKTIQGENKRWVLRDKSEGDHGPGFFYIFVRLGHIGTRPDFYIVPSAIVEDAVKVGHAAWLSGTKKDGSARKNSSMRKFSDSAGIYKEAWKLLEGEAHRSPPSFIIPAADASVTFETDR